MKLKNLLFITLFVASNIYLTAQKSYNFGESHTQTEKELPKSKAPFQKGERVPKTHVPIVIEKIGDTDYLLNTGWELAESEKVIASTKSIFDSEFNTIDWYNATVPGTVLTTLVNQGVYPDPYWGLNNLIIPESLCRTDWWYRLAFDIPKEEVGKRTFLRLNGINYKAEIWINHQLIGKMAGAFSRGEFDITNALSKGKKNILAVRILPPNNPGIPQEQNSESHGGNGGVLCLDGSTFISSEGWDWVPGIRDRNIGLWQDVQLSFRNDISIIDPQVVTDLPLPDTSSAKVSIKLQLKNNSDKAQQANIRIKLENIDITKQVDLAGSETKHVVISPSEFPALNIRNPRLWWPNGYGKPELYLTDISVMQKGSLSDKQTIRFGVREFDYELSVNDNKDIRRVSFNPIEAYDDGKVVIDNLNKVEVEQNIWIPSLVANAPSKGITPSDNNATAPYIVVKVNGVPIFCKGGNWGMDDAMKRVSRERIEPYVRLHKEQGFTMIRNWTAESTEKVFYDLCDEYGILVFNDFGLSTENINLLPADSDLFLSNVKEIVHRFRNHASIVLWCPQNEGFPPKYIENGISEIIVKEDGTRHYIGNSRTLNSIKSGPWQYTQPINYYKMAKGFASEVGSPSVPTAESVRKMMAEEDLWPIGDVWFYHDWLKGKWGKESLIQSYEDGINNQFGVSNNVDEFCKKAQLINYESYRAIFEGWNSNLFDSSTGILLWMSHPAWPSMVWQTYSWDYETPGAYFGAKKACEPIHIQYNMLKEEVEVINTSLVSGTNFVAEAYIFDLNGKKLFEEKKKTNTTSNTRNAVMPLQSKVNLPECYFIRLNLKDNKGKIVSQNFYWMSSKTPRDFTPLNNLPVTVLNGSSKAKLENGAIKGSVRVQNKSDKTALGIKLNLRNADTGKAILPTYFDEGYFTLFSGESRVVEFECPVKEFNSNLKITAEGHNVNTQDLTNISWQK